jgi:hypothetical protein
MNAWPRLSQVYGGYGGGRKMLDSGSPSRVIVNGEVH